MNKGKRIIFAVLLCILLFGNVMTILAKSASDHYKDDAIEDLQNYYKNLKIVYDLTDDALKRMDKLYKSAVDYIDDNSMSETAVDTYVAQIKSYLDRIAGNDTNPASTKEFLMLSNEVPITTAKYGEQTYLVLSLINMGIVDIEDISVRPIVSNNVKEWPFVIEQAYDAQVIQMLPASGSVEEAYQNRMDIGWFFNVRDDVKTGYYPVKFKVTYYVDKKLEETELVTYINIIGKPENGDLIEDKDEKISKPRIIVTGFTTNPTDVYAGNTFDLDVTVKNTSKEETVSNVLFKLEATVEGNDTIASYEAFLPTSGSSSVYVDSIAPGATYDINIEMEVKADLAQKPYVMKVNMVYEDSKHNEYTDTASVSVPIKQELKLDTGTVDVLPNEIAVGEESNIIFDIYNTGKTTLYNVKVTYPNDYVESGITYLGNIQPGATANVDSTVKGLADNSDMGMIQANIQYEDERGNVFEVKKDINLHIFEEVYDDAGMDDYYPDDIDMEEPGPNMTIPIAIGVGVLVIVIVIIVVLGIRKKKKKKKEEQELNDDLLS